MLASIFNLLSLLWSYFTTALSHLFLRTNTLSEDLEAGNAIEMVRTPSPVPSNFSFSAHSEVDYPAYVARPPHVHHGHIPFRNRHAFLLDIPNLYWTEDTLDNGSYELESYQFNRRWCIATREEYFHALQERASLAKWLKEQFATLPHIPHLYGREVELTGPYKRSSGRSGTQWDLA
jgi:hypothetical protein